MSQDLSQFPSGKIILLAQIEAVSVDAANQIAQLLLAIKKNVEEAEPDSLTYRLSQFGTKIVVFEEYKDQKAVKFHEESEAYKALMEAAGTLVTKPPNIEYYREL
ncbi:hypothetical protein M407DRAFT_245191 [Tulasnella calospora MUT 4182]|uniref:ABM domain-containing protein n=1 Tax=Tulasnella calospora MUT 4182 TaxID=1051891 RepID=A0A0C3Q218_9AGAM|nr:hypothetical protein M407DRAFT_245191 [Tulasnella calospora MUT 4182]